MLNNNKNAFWEAFILALIIFIFGLVLGIYFEQIRSNNFDYLLYQSETSLFDTIAFSNSLDFNKLSCDEIYTINLEFADKIYLEARELEKFDSSNKVTKNLKLIHRKYDLLRVILWNNLIKSKEKCPHINDIVYLYEYDFEDVNIKSKQVVFAKFLNELKEKKGSRFILIPIAVDSDISSLNYMTKFYNIDKFPIIIVNENVKITEVDDLKLIENQLKN